MLALLGGILQIDVRRVVAEDSEAETDANFVMTGSGGVVEIQGTAEGAPFDQGELDSMLGLAKPAIEKLFEIQKDALERN